MTSIYMMLVILAVSVEAIIIVFAGIFLYKLYLKKKYNNILPKDISIKEHSDLSDLIRLMKAEKEEKMRADRDKELADYAYKKLKGTPAGNMQSSLTHGEQPLNANTRGELIQFGMSEKDKAILKEFYR